MMFGRVPHPPTEWRVLSPARKPTGWSRLGPRRVVGTCVHRMEGTLRGTEQHFLSNDPHGRDALTDYGIGGALDGALDGMIWAWTDPADGRAPWANGPVDGLEGDGPAFVRAYGVEAVNRDLISIELSGLRQTSITPKQMDALSALIAFWHDQAGVPWTVFPRHPRTGVITQMHHGEFTKKECPFEVVRALTNAYQANARDIMRRYQTAARYPMDPSTSPSPGTDTETGAVEDRDEMVLRHVFGSCQRVLLDGEVERWADGSIRRYVFDSRGVVSNAWLARARDAGVYPAIHSWRQVPQAETRSGSTREVIQFSNGWVLIAPKSGTESGWRWLDVGERP